MSSPVRFWLHLAAIVVVSVVCGVSLYARAHAEDFQSFGDFKRTLALNRGGTLNTATGVGGGMNPVTGADLAAILEAIPDAASMRSNRRNVGMTGSYIAQVYNYSQTRSSYFNLMLYDRGAIVYADGGTYIVDYGSDTAARLTAVVTRIAKPPAGGK